MKGMTNNKDVDSKFIGLWRDIDNAASAIRELCNGRLDYKLAKKSSKWELEEMCKKLDTISNACHITRFSIDHDGADLGLHDDDKSKIDAEKTVYLVLGVVYENILEEIDFILKNADKKLSFKSIYENYDLLKYRSRIA